MSNKFENNQQIVGGFNSRFAVSFVTNLTKYLIQKWSSHPSIMETKIRFLTSYLVIETLSLKDD